MQKITVHETIKDGSGIGNVAPIFCYSRFKDADSDDLYFAQYETQATDEELSRMMGSEVTVVRSKQQTKGKNNVK